MKGKIIYFIAHSLTIIDLNILLLTFQLLFSCKRVDSKYLELSKTNKQVTVEYHCEY